jgi:hypothetical protein
LTRSVSRRCSGSGSEIASRDPFTSEGIQVALKPDGEGNWQPKNAVVVCGASRSGEPCSSCCPALNFFASMDNATAWLAPHADVRGAAISMGEAIAAGRVVFGDVLRRADADPDRP